MSKPSDPTEVPDDTPSSASWARRAGRVLRNGFAVLLLLVGGAVLALQHDGVSTWAAQTLIDRFNPLDGATISVDRVDGSWLGGLRIVDATVIRPDTSTGTPVEMAQIDTLAVAYRLVPFLLHNQVHVVRATVAGPSVTLRQAPDSTWDWARVLPASDDTTSSTLSLRLDRVDVRRARWAAAFHTASGRDSTARVTELRTALRNVRSDSTTTATLDTLGLRARIPGDTTDLALAVRGRRTSSALTLDTLRLTSPRSQVQGGGRLRLPTAPTDSLDDVRFRLSASPLAFRDVAALLPTLGLDPAETLTLDVQGRGAGRALAATATARFADGGRVDAEARATPYVEPLADTSGLHYTLDAHVHSLTTSLLGPRDPSVNRLNATVQFDLTGPSVDALSGPFRASLSETIIGGFRTDSLRLDATLTDGNARIDMTGQTYDAPFAVTGFARPLDAVPTFYMSGRVQRLNVAALAPDAGIESQIAGEVQVSGRVTGTGGPNLGLRVDMQPSTVALGRIESGTAALRITPDTLRTDLDLTLPDDGRIHLAGQAALDGSQQFRLTRGRIQNLDVAAFVGDSTRSAVSGSLAVRGQGLDPATMALDASLRLDGSRYAQLVVDRFDGTATLRDGRLSSSLALATNSGTVSTALEGRPFAPTPQFATTRGRFDDVNMAPLLADTTQSSRLSGRIRASVRGTSPQTMTANAQIDLDTSRVNRGRLDRGSVTVGLDSGRLTASIAADGADGGIAATVTAAPFADPIPFALTDGRIDGLDLLPFAGQMQGTTDLTGTLALEGRTAPDGLVLNGDLRLRDSRVNRAALSDGRLSVSVDGGRASAEGQAQIADGRLRVQATADLRADAPSYEATLSAADLPLDALAGTDASLTASVDSLYGQASGTGLNPETMQVQGTLHAEDLRGADVRVAALNVRSELRDGVVRVDTLDVRSNVVIARGGGTVALFDTTSASRFDLTADVTGIAPLQSLLGARTLTVSQGSMEAHVYGDGGTLRYDGEAELQNLAYDDIRLADLSVAFNGAGPTTAPVQRMEIVGSLGFLSLPGLTVEQTDVQATLDTSLVDFTATTRLDREHTVRLSAQVDPRLGRERVTLQALDLRFGPDRFRLVQEASLSYGDQYRLSGLLLASTDQQIAADGVIDFNGMQSLIVTVEQFRLGTLADLSGLTGLDGRMTGTVDLSGPATAPRLTSSLALDIRSGDEDVGTLDLRVDYDSLATRVDATLTHTEGGTLTADGSVPLDLRLAVPDGAATVDMQARPLRLTAQSDAFSVGWLDPFIDPALLRDIGGTLNGRVDVRGSRGQPAFDGRLSLRDGRVYLPDTEVLYTDASATLAFEGARATITDARLTSPNGGRLDASGTITFPALTLGEFDLALQAENVVAIDTRAYRTAIVDGQMTLRGTTRRPVLNGTVSVQSADVYYTEALAETEQSDLATVQLSQDDQLTLEQRFGLRLAEADTTTFDTYQAMAMDLSVEIKRNTWLRSNGSPELNIQFTGDLDLTKAPDQDAQVFGSIEVIPGRSSIRQFGQEFALREGTLTFNGDPTTPFLRATAVFEKRSRQAQETEVTITLTLEGRPDDLDPTLSSDPSMDTRNILSYLATGRPASQLLSGGGKGGTLATKVALGQATNFVENLAASELGLDVVRVQLDPRGTSYLTVGRYFTPRFFVSIEQPVTSQVSGGTGTSTALVPALTLEYQLTSYMLLRIQNRQQSLNTNLLVKYAY